MYAGVGQPVYGAAILTVGERVRLFVVGSRATHASSAIYVDVSIPEAAASHLVGGGSIRLGPSSLHEARVLENGASAAYPVTEVAMAVDRVGHLAVQVSLEGGGVVRVEGRLLGACEHVDANASLRHVVDTSTHPRCD